MARRCTGFGHRRGGELTIDGPSMAVLSGSGATMTVARYGGRWHRSWIVEQCGTWVKLVDLEAGPNEAVHGEALPAAGEAWRQL
jgi:hypothetical protein